MLIKDFSVPIPPDIMVQNICVNVNISPEDNWRWDTKFDQGLFHIFMQS